MRMELWRRKGVSEIVASIMLLFIVSSIGVFLYSFTITNTNIQMDEVRNQAEREVEKANERFRITSVTNLTTNQFTVTVLNYGDVETKIVDIYAKGQSVSSITYQQGDGTIPVNEIRTIEFTTSQSSLQLPIDFTLVSETGTSYKTSWTP